MSTMMLVLALWVTLSVVAAAGFCLLCRGARSRGVQDLATVSAPVRTTPERERALV